MIICPNCGAEETDDSARFCEECGCEFTKECPECHAKLKLSAKLCKYCGHRFTAQGETGKGAMLGDNNMVSGDVVNGNVDSRKFYGNNNGNTTTYSTSSTSNVITNNTSNNTAYWRTVRACLLECIHIENTQGL